MTVLWLPSMAQGTFMSVYGTPEVNENYQQIIAERLLSIPTPIN